MTFTVADCQHLSSVVPMKWDCRVRSIFIVVIVVFIFVEREIAISSSIDAQFNGIWWLLSTPLLLGTHRHDRSRSNEQRNAIQRSRSINTTRPFGASAHPEIEPLGLREIKTPRLSCWVRHGIHQDGGPEHELISNVCST